MTRDDLEVVRKALELGGAMADYEAAQRVMDAGIAALSRLEAQPVPVWASPDLPLNAAKALGEQPTPPICPTCDQEKGVQPCVCSNPFHLDGEYKDGIRVQPTPPECPVRKALKRIIPEPGTEYARDGRREIVLDVCGTCGAMCEHGVGSLQHHTEMDCGIAQAALSTPCSPCQRCAEAERVKAEIIAEYIDDHGITCDCCQHVMIDVTAALENGRSHCTAGDPEGEGVGCGHSWHETAGKLEAERDALTRKVERLVDALERAARNLHEASELLRGHELAGCVHSSALEALAVVEHEKEQG